MPENRGLYSKFIVHRRDGRDQPGGDREDASYFVLDIRHDPYALRALREYAAACAYDLPELSADLLAIADDPGQYPARLDRE